jgi:hypothetical protein
MHTLKYIIKTKYLADRKKFYAQNGMIPRPIPNTPLETVESVDFARQTPSLPAPTALKMLKAG